MTQPINLEAIWHQYRSSIQAFLKSKVSDPDEVDDLLQEILIKIHQNLHTLKSQNSVKAWLFQIANHSIIDFYRKRNKIQNVDAADLWYVEDQDQQTQQALSQCIKPFIAALPEETSHLLTEIELNGQSQKVFAETHDINYSTLKSRVQKGREQLKTLFEDCCDLSLDKHGAVIDFDPKSNTCENC